MGFQLIRLDNDHDQIDGVFLDVTDQKITLLNFGHPLTAAQRSQIQALLKQENVLSGTEIEVRDFPFNFEHDRPFQPQATELVDSTGLSSTDWQVKPLLINPPTHHHFALVLLAELHGRMGYFPAVVRLKPVNGAIPPQFDVAEILNLQAIRDQARARR